MADPAKPGAMWCTKVGAIGDMIGQGTQRHYRSACCFTGPNMNDVLDMIEAPVRPGAKFLFFNVLTCTYKHER